MTKDMAFLDDWQALEISRKLVILVGYVTGHRLLPGERRHIRTSVVKELDLVRKVAVTSSCDRIYLLSKPDEGRDEFETAWIRGQGPYPFRIRHLRLTTLQALFQGRRPPAGLEVPS